MKPAVYEGNEPYIFISYAHRDSAAVFEVLSELQARGYRLWYDDGIAPGSEWPEDIAQHLDAAAMVIAFVTPSSMASQNCRREISFSLAREKPFLSILLEPTDVPLGMQMQLFAQQSIVRYNYDSWDGFIKKVLSCPDIEPCRGLAQPGTESPHTPKQPAPAATSWASAPPASDASAKRPRTAPVVAGIAAAAVVIVLAIAFAFGGGQKTTEASVYMDRLVDYYPAGFYQTVEDLDKANDSGIALKAFSLVSFLKTNAEDSVMVESSACKIETLEAVEEPVLKMAAAVVGNTLYVYGVNDGWGASDPVDMDVAAWSGNAKLKSGLDDFAKTLFDADAITYGSGDVRLVRSCSIDVEAFKNVASFEEAKGTWYVLIGPNETGTNGSFVVMYKEDTDAFSINSAGGTGGNPASVDLFAVLDVDKGPGSLMFSSAESQPLIDGVCRISMTIAPTKSCELTCRGEFSVDGCACESEPHTVKAIVPVFEPAALRSCSSDASLSAELAQNPDATTSEIDEIAARYRYDPESILANDK